MTDGAPAVLGPANRRLILHQGEPIVLGRSDITPDMQAVASQVSRAHCELLWHPDSCPPRHVQLRATSISNPVFVLRAGWHGDQAPNVQALLPGQTTLLAPGDGFSMLPDPGDDNVWVCEAPAAVARKAGPQGSEAAPLDATLPNQAADQQQPEVQDGALAVEAASQPVLLLLAGAPGSGKSTFSKALQAARPELGWVHINQDTIKNGQPGDKRRCLSAARAALAAGKCVIIDRCNAEPNQRDAFLELAQDLRVPMHCVVLALPVQVCLQRVIQRTGHPGNVQGPAAAGIVRMFHASLLKAGPSAAEGYASYRLCRSVAEADTALHVWQRFDGSPATLPASGCGPIMVGPLKATADIKRFFTPTAKQGSGTAATAGIEAGAGTSVSNPATSAPNRQPQAKKAKVSEGKRAEHEQRLRSAPAAPGEGRAGPGGVTAHHVPMGSSAQADAASPSGPGSPGALRNAFSVLMGASSQQHQLRRNTDTQAAGFAASSGQGMQGLRHWPPWAMALRNMALRPETIDRSADPHAHVDEQVICICDAYPKARLHALVVARQPGLESVADLRAEHGPLLQHMWDVGLNFARAQRPPGGRLVLRLGFHAKPSMCQLHLHVISADLCGAGMRKREHFVSFATRFFIPLSQAQHELATNGHINTSHAAACLAQPLSCPRCGATASGRPGRSMAGWTLPDLKQHVMGCAAGSWPEDGVVLE